MAKTNARLVVICALLALLIIPLFSSAFATRYSSAQLVSGVPSSLSFGYGPTSMTPLSEGIPVYSISDQMWVQSSANQSITLNLISPSGAYVASTTLAPFSDSLIYTFAPSDPEGTWSVSIATQQGSNAFPLLVVNPANHLLTGYISYFSLQSANLNMGFNFSKTNAYNVEGCFAPNSSQLRSVTLSIPSGIGTGRIQLVWNGSNSNSTVYVNGGIVQPFSFWFSLYYTYSYSLSNSSALVSRQMQVAQSDTALFTQNTNNASIPLRTQAVLRDGRYVLRSFFETATGLSASESRVLIVGPSGSRSWISLDSCKAFPISAPSTFQQSVSLNTVPSLWPTAMYYMYDVDGIDSVGFLPLDIQIARIAFQGTPWNVSLSDLSFAVENNSAYLQTASDYQGSVYVASSQFPISVTVQPSFSGQNLQPVTVLLNQPSTSYNAKIPLGKIECRVTLNGDPLNDTSVLLYNSKNQSISQQYTNNGNATFYVPAGRYYLKATFGATTDTVGTDVTSYLQTPAILSFVKAPVPADYAPDAAIVLAVIGVFLNIYVWVIRPFQDRRS